VQKQASQLKIGLQTIQQTFIFAEHVDFCRKTRIINEFTALNPKYYRKLKRQPLVHAEY